MLFEFSIAKKYLIPRKRRLAMSLIALMSIGVISLVVWLVLVFLSVTAGIEKSWIRKLTTLNAPIRIAPTAEYYASYYHNIDSISLASDYTYRNIAQKKEAALSDPYSPQEDPVIPSHWPEKHLEADRELKDLVKLAFVGLKRTSAPNCPLIFQDYEVAVAQLNVEHTHPAAAERKKQKGCSSHLCLLSSFSEQNPQLHELLKPPGVQDLNSLLELTRRISPEMDQASRQALFQKRIISLFSGMTITRVITTEKAWTQLSKLISNQTTLHAFATLTPEGNLAAVFLPSHQEATSFPNALVTKPLSGQLAWIQNRWVFTGENERVFVIDDPKILHLMAPLSLTVEGIPSSFATLTSLEELTLRVRGQLQNKPLEGEIFWEGIAIEAAQTTTLFAKKPSISPPWPYAIGEKTGKKISVFSGMPEMPSGVILPKSFEQNGVKLGDRGSFAYMTTTLSSLQEQHLPVTVCGFYDPGILGGLGPKPVLTTPEIVRDIQLSSQAPPLIPFPTNGIHVWFENLSQTADICAALRSTFADLDILRYWSITPFYHYEFAKDLMQQFKSDKYLLTLIAALILLVACTNIFSLLIILVGEKKREIAILRAMGTSTKSIALIFTLCGGIMGLVSTLIGVVLAYFTLQHIDALAHFLSFLQGQEAFHTAFYGKSLPNTLSREALKFIAIATPLFSILAGWIPAFKACRTRPSEILRS